MSTYQVLRDKNDYLKEFVGKTYNRKTLNHVNSFYRDRFGKFSARSLDKFSLVACLEPSKRYQEILGLGGSSLLQHSKTKEIIPNLILDNFGKALACLFSNAANVQPVKDVTNTTRNINFYRSTNNVGDRAAQFVDIKLGSGALAPTRGDYEIQTPLTTAPESNHLTINAGAYTVSNTVIYQGDANPTGGTGTVNEIGTYGNWIDGNTGLIYYFLLAHDAISPGVPFTSGRLLRGSYTWQL